MVAMNGICSRSMLATRIHVSIGKHPKCWLSGLTTLCGRAVCLRDYYFPFLYTYFISLLPTSSLATWVTEEKDVISDFSVR